MLALEAASAVALVSTVSAVTVDPAVIPAACATAAMLLSLLRVVVQREVRAPRYIPWAILTPSSAWLERGASAAAPAASAAAAAPAFSIAPTAKREGRLSCGPGF